MNKKRQIDRIVRGFARQIEHVEKDEGMFCQIPVGLICEAFPQGEWHNLALGGFEFRLPMSFELIEDVKCFMALQFPEFKFNRQNQHIWESSGDAGIFLNYKKGSWSDDDVVTFDFAFRSSEEGTTCVLNQIGTKEVPVFEVVCGEQAKDWAA